VQYDEITKLLKKQKNLNTIQKNNVKIFEDLLKTAKVNHMNVIEKDIKVIKDNEFTQNQAEAASVWKAKLGYIHAQFSQIEKYVLDTDLMQKPFDRTIYNIETEAYSAKDVKKLLTKIGKQDLETKKINDLEFNSALTKIDNDEQERLRIYLNDVLNGTIDPADEKFVPTQEANFYDLVKEIPFLEGYIKFTNKKTEDKDKKGTGSYVPGGTEKDNTITITKKVETTNTVVADPTYT
jgi:hypothetical protein